MSNASSKLGSVIGTIVVVAVSLVLGWMGSGFWIAHKQAAGQAKMAAMAVRQAAVVAVTNAEMRVYNLPEQHVAHAEAVQEVDLLPQVDGYIKELKFKEGDLVKAGEILYVLDDERYQAIVGQRKADLAAAQAEQSRADRYFKRMQEADERGITQLERDNAEAASLSAAAQVKQAEANLVVAEYDLKKTIVRAPIAGQIGKTTAHVGDYVAPSKGALARIVQTDPIRISFPMTDREYVAWRQQVRKGQKSGFYTTRIILPDGSVYDKEGTWAFDDNEMSLETASIMMRLNFPNPDRLLVPNTYVTLLSYLTKPPKYLCVPQQCVIDLSGGKQGVWIVKDDMTVESRGVTTKEASEGWTPIVDGLKGDEKIVLSGVGKLANGMKVMFSTPTGNDDIVKDFKEPIAE